MNLILGVVMLILGGLLLAGIISEMLNAYLGGSKYAYIGGIIFCVLILISGLYFLVRAFGFERQIFKHYSLEDKAKFLRELADESTLCFGHHLIITRHYLLYTEKAELTLKLIKIEDITACFGKPYYAAENEMVQYDLIFADRRFKISRCMVKGKKAAIMEEAWKAICGLAPWVFSEHYLEFISGLTKRSKKRSYGKMIEHRRQTRDVSEEDIQEEMITAADLINKFNQKAAQEPQEKLLSKAAQTISQKGIGGRFLQRKKDSEVSDEILKGEHKVPSEESSEQHEDISED